MIVKWPAKVKAGSNTEHVYALWDVMPTLADKAQVKLPTEGDGIPFFTRFDWKKSKTTRFFVLGIS